MSAMSYYAILGVAEDADRETIRSAFRALARRYHPDAGTGSSTAEFRRILEAYEVLIDPERRRTHDDALALARQPRRTPISRVEPLRPTARRGSPVAEPLFTGASIRPRVGRDPIARDLHELLAMIEQAFFTSFRYR